MLTEKTADVDKITGLAIARKIITLHKGTITVEIENDLMVFTVTGQDCQGGWLSFSHTLATAKILLIP